MRSSYLQSAYLSIETHTDQPGLIRIGLNEWRPAIPGATAQGVRRVRYIARFNDGEAALMHAHQLLRSRLADVDARLYRCDLVTAVAAIESIGLGHTRIHLDPGLNTETYAAIQSRVLVLTVKRHRRERLWDSVGYIALGFLLVQALTGLL
jgi:hypothetical protein